MGGPGSWRAAGASMQRPSGPPIRPPCAPFTLSRFTTHLSRHGAGHDHGAAGDGLAGGVRLEGGLAELHRRQGQALWRQAEAEKAWARGRHGPRAPARAAAECACRRPVRQSAHRQRQPRRARPSAVAAGPARALVMRPAAAWPGFRGMRRKRRARRPGQPPADSSAQSCVLYAQLLLEMLTYCMCYEQAHGCAGILSLCTNQTRWLGAPNTPHQPDLCTLAHSLHAASPSPSPLPYITPALLQAYLTPCSFKHRA